MCDIENLGSYVGMNHDEEKEATSLNFVYLLIFFHDINFFIFVATVKQAIFARKALQLFKLYHTGQGKCPHSHVSFTYHLITNTQDYEMRMRRGDFKSSNYNTLGAYSYT